MREPQAEARQATPSAAVRGAVFFARLLSEELVELVVQVEPEVPEQLGPTAARVKHAGASTLREITYHHPCAPVRQGLEPARSQVFPVRQGTR
jgi:hypothetical protein